MKKKSLFKNYTYSFDSNEIKILNTFCKQAISQMQGDSKFFADVKAFSSIQEKLNSGEEEIKLTKDEKIRLVHQLKANVEAMEKTMSKAGFIKRWLYKSMLKQYKAILENHFND